MSSDPEDGTFPPLTCNALLYRPIITKSWINKHTGAVDPAVFRRRAADLDGLSVNIVACYSVEECIESPNYKECFAIGTLHVGRVLDITLPSGTPGSSTSLSLYRDSLTHANIVGLPAYGETGPPYDANREYLANQLARQWRSVWYSLKVRPPGRR
jgi:hypothetical protein